MGNRYIRSVPQLTIGLICSMCLWLGMVQAEPELFMLSIHRSISASSLSQQALYVFPAGGRTLFPAYRLVALYGAPGAPALGVLGQQSSPVQAVAAVKSMASAYQPLVHAHILPTLEIIATVAVSEPTDNNDYSRETDAKLLSQWVATAHNGGVYVVLDLQPGRSSFLAQAKLYESLLLQPNVGLALDPEWRLGPDQVPLVQIGSVSIDEVNSVSSWLATLIIRHHLPQKLFLLHEFSPAMLPDRARLNTAHAQLAYTIQMDGQGTQPEKAATWDSILASPPEHVHFGWKNFTTKDAPMLTPRQTMAVAPTPWYVSYQ